VFYVRDGYGHKVRHEERLKSVQARLLRALQSEPLEAPAAVGA
jgi:hypothetical protein